MKKLKWEDLLCSKRVRESNNAAIKSERNDFEADYDRIVGSSSVRRLQDKAQVYPLQANDFVRTRLTHSIEVSGIARSLGKQVAKRLVAEGKENLSDDQIDYIEAIMQTVGLIHDIGNPPFGHFGESIIRNWFKNNKKILSGLNKKEKHDFLYFDGNVQGFRIVTKLQMLNDRFGANFTYATLAVLMKYPWESINTNIYGKEKYGYYQSEADLVKDIREKTGLEEGVRHPLTYLLEAADDITYIGDDIEDGVKKGLIDWATTYQQFKNEFSKNDNIKNGIIDKISKINQEINLPDKNIADSRNFRNIVQGFMIKHAIDNFIKYYDKIMNGEFGAKDLFEDDNDISQIIKWYKELMNDNCYSCSEVLGLELSGQKVIHTLLDCYIKNLVKADKRTLEDIESYPNRLLESISDNYVFIAINTSKKKVKSFSDLPLYNKLQLCVDYISGMTDSYAVRQYKKIMGISLSLKG